MFTQKLNVTPKLKASLDFENKRESLSSRFAELNIRRFRRNSHQLLLEASEGDLLLKLTANNMLQWDEGQKL